MWSELVTLAGDALIAGVIYYEIEGNRASEFMKEVQSPEYYEKRAHLYDAFASLRDDSLAKLPKVSLKHRTEAFHRKIRDEPALRELCDAQWTYLSRARYGLSWSCHRHLLADWFPQVVVSFWAMTADYIRERERRRSAPMDYGIKAVRESLEEMLRLSRRPNWEPLTIFSRFNTRQVEITAEELERMLAELNTAYPVTGRKTRFLVQWGRLSRCLPN